MSERPPTPEEVRRTLALVLATYTAKNPGYADSWCRRGAQGIFHNVARKFDRVEHQCLTTGEPQRVDDLLDLATYALLQLAWHSVNRPERFTAWAATDEGRSVVGSQEATALEDDRQQLHAQLEAGGLTWEEEDRVKAQLGYVVAQLGDYRA